MSELVTSLEDDLLILTLNRPEKRNALSFAMLEALEREVERAAVEPAVHAVIITGAGGKAFSAGMDLQLLLEHQASRPSGAQLRKVQAELQDLFNGLERLEKPVVAAVEGACVGGGLELALACDLRVASAEATFGFPEARIGMIPDLGGTARLARMVGPGIAKEWIFTARRYPASRARELGLVNEVVTPGSSLEVAKALAREVAGNGPLAVAWAKRIVDRAPGMSREDAELLEQYAMTEILPGAELKEGVLSSSPGRSSRRASSRSSRAESRASSEGHSNAELGGGQATDIAATRRPRDLSSSRTRLTASGLGGPRRPISLTVTSDGASRSTSIRAPRALSSVR
jgi:methylglutaconyl-CoA hydratase